MTSNVGADTIKKQTTHGLLADQRRSNYEKMREKILEEAKTQASARSS